VVDRERKETTVADPAGRDLRRQRSNAVRTAWALAVVVLLIFAAFVLSGVLGQAPAQ